MGFLPGSSNANKLHHTALKNYSLFLNKIRAAVNDVLPAVLAKRNHRTEKADKSYVTEGDLIVQDCLIQLANRHVPEAFIVSEELGLGAEAAYATGAVIVIDPIDGTENFTSGLPEWGVSVSCYLNGVHAGSLIGCPEMGFWLASAERCEKFTSRIRGLSSSLSKEDLVAATQGYEYRILGCCVYNMINVIRGSFRSFENPKGASSWDILAGLNLALEHGLSVTVNNQTYAGEYLPPNCKYRFKVENR